MRLLNAKTLQLKEFFDSQVPNYSILSHRWGEGEVSFADFRKRRDCVGPGYEKIIKCCEISLARGFEWTWIDTCCIDKRSSAELSEAINSMFNWYRRSSECFVFLPDVGPLPGDDGGHGHSAPKDNGGYAAFDKKAFRTSVWFQRGWTLQELIAPSFVTFFNTAHEPIGVKVVTRILDGAVGDGVGPDVVLNGLISAVTGIGPSYLDGRYVSQASVAARMSWASRRQTERKEDVAYCLLGIFGINMPLLYGEGDRAFRRLQLEIMRTLDDDSLFAWTRLDSNMCDSYSRRVLIAHSPSCFLDCGDLRRLRLGRRYKNAFKDTNRGITLKIPNFGLPVLHVLQCERLRPSRYPGLPDHEFAAIFLHGSYDTLWSVGIHGPIRVLMADSLYARNIDNLVLSLRCTEDDKELLKADLANVGLAVFNRDEVLSFVRNFCPARGGGTIKDSVIVSHVTGHYTILHPPTESLRRCVPNKEDILGPMGLAGTLVKCREFTRVYVPY